MRITIAEGGELTLTVFPYLYRVDGFYYRPYIFLELFTNNLLTHLKGINSEHGVTSSVFQCTIQNP